MGPEAKLYAARVTTSGLGCGAVALDVVRRETGRVAVVVVDCATAGCAVAGWGWDAKGARYGVT
jgi:hypothetical protein